MKLGAMSLLLLVMCFCMGMGGAEHGEMAKQQGHGWYDLSFGRLYVPEHLKAEQGAVDLLIHFHGSPSYLVDAVNERGLNVAVLSVSLNGLSSVYTRPFAEDKDLFERMLLESVLCLHELEQFADTVKLGQIGVSSFSAGFGAVREILKDNRYFGQITTLLMADSLYAGYVDVDGKKQPNPKQMRDFRRFAKEAAAGKKRFLITHSYIDPKTYAGTQHTADDLIKAVGTRRTKVQAELEGGVVQNSHAEKGQFEVIGCEGVDGPAHMQHLREIGQFINMMGFDRVEVAE